MTKTNWMNKFAVALLLTFTACSTQPIRSSHRGLLEDSDSTAGTSHSSSRRAPADLYAIRPGGAINLTGDWQWPLEHVEISSPYGERGGKFHQGLDLRAAMRTPVHAAADGTVVYVGSKIRGYGRMIVIKHPGNYYTVYAHHSKNLVKMGRPVVKGQVIAYSGKSGHSSGPHLHFELRQGTQSFDPEYAFVAYFKTSVNRKVASKSNLSHDFEE